MAKKRKQTKLEAKVTEILGRHDLEGLMEHWKFSKRPNHYDIEAEIILERMVPDASRDEIAAIVAEVFNEYFHGDDDAQEDGPHDPKDAKIVACTKEIAKVLNEDSRL
jgi:hypothetical protein